MFVDQRFHSWQHSGTVSHRQRYRNVPQHRDELWSLISRARSPLGLLACVRHSPPQIHTGEAAASCGWFPACGVCLSHRVTPGWHASCLLHLSEYCLFGDLSDCIVTCLPCLSAFVCKCIYFSDFCTTFNLPAFLRQTILTVKTSEQLQLHTMSTLWMNRYLCHHQNPPATRATLKKPSVGSRVVLLCPVPLYSQLTPVCFPLFSLYSGKRVQEKEI